MNTNTAVHDQVSVGDDGLLVRPEHSWLYTMLAKHITSTQQAAEQALADNRNALRQALVAATPNCQPVQASGKAPSSGNLYLDLGGPQLGRKWLVRLLKCSDAVAVGNSATGKANWYIGQVPTVSGVSGPANWIWAFSSLPGIQNFTSESLAITPGDHLYCEITTPTSAQVYLAGGLILDYPAVQDAGPGVPVY